MSQCRYIVLATKRLSPCTASRGACDLQVAQRFHWDTTWQRTCSHGYTQPYTNISHGLLLSVSTLNRLPKASAWKCSIAPWHIVIKQKILNTFSKAPDSFFLGGIRCHVLGAWEDQMNHINLPKLNSMIHSKALKTEIEVETQLWQLPNHCSCSVRFVRSPWRRNICQIVGDLAVFYSHQTEVWCFDSAKALCSIA